MFENRNLVFYNDFGKFQELALKDLFSKNQKTEVLYEKA